MDISRMQVQSGGTGGGAGLGQGGTSKAGPGTEPTFADTWNRIQAQYGKKPEQQRQFKKQLDKDDFMRIMITQMQHQDPTKPFEADKIAQEIAQITTVENLSLVSRALDKLSTQNRPLERLAMTNLIGREITVDRNRFTHYKGDNTPVNFSLPENASQVSIAIISEKGDVVLEKEIGPKDAGEVTFNWDGKKGNTMDAEGGVYMMRITAKGDRDQVIQTDMKQKARVIGVSFQGDQPVFLVGDAANPARVPMDSVVQIDQSAGGMPGMPGMPQMAAPAGDGGGQQAAPQAKAPSAPSSNFFTFEKGIGSKPVDGSKANDLHTAMARYGAQAAAARGAQDGAQAQDGGGAAQAAPEQKGFPNGMGVYNEANQEGGEGE